jgi:type IV pilus assembly protein PilM
MSKAVWGIDVSKSSVKAVRLEGAGESVTLTQVAVFPFEATGEAQDMEVQVRNALAQLKATTKVGAEPIIFSLPSHSTFNRLIKLPPVDDAKIPEIVKFEAQSQIPFPMDEVLWDHQYVERDYQPGEEKEVILFAVKKDVVEEFMRGLSEFAFNIEAIQFGPVALFNFLVRDQETGGPCVALDMGGDNTDLIVVDGNKFWVRNLPKTGNDITRALEKAFNIPFEEAEKLKLKAGQSQQAQKIFNAIQPDLRDLVNEINRSMGYYKSISKTSKFEKIFLLGNATKTLNFQKFVSQSLQLNAARVQKLNTIAVGGGVDPGDLNENLASIGTALGLALQGLVRTPNHINLLPPSYLQAKEAKKKQPFYMVAAAALFALAGLAWWQQSGEVTRLRKTKQTGEAVLRMATQQEDEFKKVKEVAAVKDALENLVAVSSERDLILKIIDKIAPNVPDTNGKWEAPENQKLWVVDWKFEEREKPKEAAAGAAPGAMPAVQHPPGTMKPLPTSKVLQAVLEVVIAKPSGYPVGRQFIMTTLLNYNPQNRQPARAGQPCVVKDLDLQEGSGWRVELDHKEGEDLVWPAPKNFPTDAVLPDVEKKGYSRYRVTLEVPVGEEARKPAAAADKAGEKKS